MLFSPLRLIVLLLLLSCAKNQAAEWYQVEVVYLPKGIFTSGIATPDGDTGKALAAAIADPKTEKILFPKLKVEAGVEGTASEQKDFSYVSAYDSDGKATQSAIRKIGPLLTSTVTPSASEVLDVALHAENVAVEQYKTYKTGSDAELKQPVFGLRDLGPSLFHVRKGYWVLIGGFPQERPAGTFAFRVTSVAP